MFSAAFSSRSITSPQEGQTWVRTERLFGTRSPQPEQSWLVYCGRHRSHSLPGPCCLVCEDAPEVRPPGITDAFGEVAVPEHVANLQIFQIDHVVLPEQGERGLMVEVAPLTPHLLVLTLQAVRRPSCDDCFPSSAARRGVVL